MALTTVGRRSGARRTTPVTAFACAGKLAAAGMNLGSERSPAWSHNLQADPHAWITLGGGTVAVIARLASGTEHEELWARWTELQPSATAFAQLANRAIPIFVFEERGAAPMPGTPARDQSSSESLT